MVEPSFGDAIVAGHRLSNGIQVTRRCQSSQPK